jgi:hypothetical protein
MAAAEEQTGKEGLRLLGSNVLVQLSLDERIDWGWD